MKQFIVFIALLLFNFSMQAQVVSTRIIPGTFTVNGKTFIAAVDTETSPQGRLMMPNTMRVVLQSGTIMNPVANPGASQECFASVTVKRYKGHSKPDFLRYFNILRSVFPASRCTAIVDNDNLLLGTVGVNCTFNVTATGVVKDVVISISENNIITPQEIELLYTTLTTQMSFTTNPVNCPSYVGFMFEDEMREMEDLKIIHSEPYYFGNGPRWAGR